MNDKVYVGQTFTPLNRRLSYHKSASKNKNSTLYQAMQTYGTDKFHIELLEEVVGSDKRQLRKEMLKKEYDYAIALSATTNGYNMVAGGGWFTIVSEEYANRCREQGLDMHRKYSKEQYLEWSKLGGKTEKWYEYMNSGAPQENYIKHKEARVKGLKEALGIKVAQYTKEGEYITTFDSIVDASNSTGVSCDAISNIIKGITKRPHKYLWKQVPK